MSIEAMKMALDVLIRYITPQDPHGPKRMKAIAALRQEIESDGLNDRIRARIAYQNWLASEPKSTI
jgi:microsomal dipeptidase-like Zn-dependent dipeptidase